MADFTCPECKRVMDVVAKDGELHVNLLSEFPAAPCCEKSASQQYSKLAYFSTRVANQAP